LDSYGAERVPIGEVLLGSTRKAAALVTLRNLAAPVALPVGLGFLNAVKPLKRKIEHKIMRGFCGLALHYEDGPLTKANEPGQRHGIRPGHRVETSERTAREHPGWAALRDELTDPRWKLLVFAAADGHAEDMVLALKHIDRRHGAVVSVRTVVEGTTSGGIPHGMLPLADPGGALRRDFAAHSGDFALIRPDGYLAGVGPLRGVSQLTATLRACGLT
jgi:NADPH-dependent dioxygenase